MKRIALALSVLALLLPVSAVEGKDTKKKDKPDVAESINTPRADGRKVTLELEEGTWLSVDVSPDGGTLVIDLLGDLYTLPSSGGQAKAITSGPAYDTQPRFSPDGKTIAFTSDRSGIDNIWLVDADGKNPRSVSEEKDYYVRTPAWSPEGTFLFARREDGKRAGIPPVELWMYHVSGGSGIKVTSSDDTTNASGPVASKDGRFVYFSARSRSFSYTPNLSDGLWQIQRYDRLTAETRPLTTGFGGAVRPAVSPDGRQLVFVSRRDGQSVLVSRDLETGAESILLRDVDRDEMEGFAQADLWPNYAFTPDGSALVFSHRGKLTRLDLATRSLSGIPFKAKSVQTLAPLIAWQDRVETGPVAARILRWPTQSSDAKWIAFDAFGRIWLQRLEGGKVAGSPRRLTADDPSLPAREYSPAMSPDGKSITWVSWSDAEGGHIWKSQIPSGDEAVTPVRLSKSRGHYTGPVFSPKGDRIAFVQGSGLEFRGRQPEEEEVWEIRWISSDGGESHYVAATTTGESMRFHPRAFWSRDGDRIFYRDPVEQAKPTDDPKHDLISVRLDGTDKRKLLRFPAVGDVVPSPDEAWIAFTSRDNVYVTAMPGLLTEEAPEITIDDGAVPVWRLSKDAGGYVNWADGGKTITWALANDFHRLPLTEAIRFAQEKKKKDQAKEKEDAKDDRKADKDEKDDDKDGDKDEAKGDDKEVSVPRSQILRISLSMPRATPAGSYVLRGGRVIPMKGDEVLENADVVVTGNRIVAVGPSGAVSVPAGATEIDARGKTIIPGLIDTHAHLHYSAMELFPDQKWEYIANLAYGVTSTYDPSAPSLDVFAQAEMVDAGLMVGPRVWSSGDVLYGGQQTDIWSKVDSQEDARRQVRRMKAYGARMIKVYQQPRRSQRMWFAEACRELRMLATTEGAGEVYTNMSMILDGYTAFEHSLPLELRQDVIQLTAKGGTFYTPTLLVSYGGPWGELYYWQNRNPHDDPKLNRFVPHLMLDVLGRRHPWIWPSEYHFPTVARGAASVLRAGGKVSLGAHGQLQGLGPHWELWAMAGEGNSPDKGTAMTPMEALRASTILAAEKIGFAPDLGSIEKGKLADLVVLDANPLEDIHNTVKIKWVSINGVLYDAETMRQELPEKRELKPFYWNQN